MMIANIDKREEKVLTFSQPILLMLPLSCDSPEYLGLVLGILPH